MGPSLPILCVANACQGKYKVQETWLGLSLGVLITPLLPSRDLRRPSNQVWHSLWKSLYLISVHWFDIPADQVVRESGHVINVDSVNWGALHSIKSFSISGPKLNGVRRVRWTFRVHQAILSCYKLCELVIWSDVSLPSSLLKVPNATILATYFRSSFQRFQILSFPIFYCACTRKNLQI